MVLEFTIHSKKRLQIDDFLEFLSVPGMEYQTQYSSPLSDYFVLFRKEQSTTYFAIEFDLMETYTVGFDQLSSYEDYKLLPYLLDSLSRYLNNEPYLQTVVQLDKPTLQVSAYQYFCEEWREHTIGETIATVKCILYLHLPVLIELPLNRGWYFNESVLNNYGVDIHSSTSRIYGYIQYLLRKECLPYFEDDSELMNMNFPEDEQVVNVPQHESIGTVSSWQTDGSVTTESFCRQDVALLMNIGQRYDAGQRIDGAVLNDLGTIYQEGIGVEKDVEQAIKWFQAAILMGDHTFAPSSLGDIYRKGLGSEGVRLDKAYRAYASGDDPYAYYRLGQAYEEGWLGTVDMERAMKWYKKAADMQHHLALKRLSNTLE